MTWGLVIALFGAAVSVTLACIGSAVGVGMAGEASAGVVSENPDLSGRLLLLQALPGTQGIYGLLVAFLILINTGVLTGSPEALSLGNGLAYFAASCIMGFGGWLSAVAQGKTAVAGIQLVARRPEESGKAIVMTVMVETYAVLSLLLSLFIVFFI